MLDLTKKCLLISSVGLKVKCTIRFILKLCGANYFNVASLFGINTGVIHLKLNITKLALTLNGLAAVVDGCLGSVGARCTGSSPTPGAWLVQCSSSHCA